MKGAIQRTASDKEPRKRFQLSPARQRVSDSAVSHTHTWSLHEQRAAVAAAAAAASLAMFLA